MKAVVGSQAMQRANHQRSLSVNRISRGATERRRRRRRCTV
jgi:hypothetical protein